MTYVNTLHYRGNLTQDIAIGSALGHDEVHRVYVVEDVGVDLTADGGPMTTVYLRYANASDYVRDLIREDQEKANAIAELQGLIDEGIASGISDRTLDEVFEDARQRAMRALEKRDGSANLKAG